MSKRDVLENIGSLNGMIDDCEVIVVDYMDGKRIVSLEEVGDGFVGVCDDESEVEYDDLEEMLKCTFYSQME